jgi:aquaporin Z
MLTSPYVPRALARHPLARAAGARAGVKFVVEAIGTFLLVFTVGVAVVTASPLAPVGIGAVLVVMIYAGTRLTAGHYDPAVTLSALARRRIGLNDAVGYWIIQLGAGLLAAIAVGDVIGPDRVAARAAMTWSGHTLWVYLVAQVTAGLAAGVIFLALNPDDK